MVNQIRDPHPLDVLADPTRRAILTTLAERPRPASDLAARFGISKPAISRHLRLLRLKGLVEEFGVPDDRRLRMYRLRPEPLEEIGRWAEMVREFWAHQLLAFSEFARDERLQRSDTRARRRHGRRRQGR